MSTSRCLCYTKVSVQFRGLCECFVTRYVFTVNSCWHFPQPQAWRQPLVGPPQLLTQYIRSYPPYWRPLLHPQHDDAIPRWQGPAYHGIFKVRNLKFMQQFPRNVGIHQIALCCIQEYRYHRDDKYL